MRHVRTRNFTQDSDLAHFLENGVKLKKLVRLSHLVSSAGISRSSRMANDAIAADKIPITEPTPAVRKITVVANAFYKQNQLNWEAFCSIMANFA